MSGAGDQRNFSRGREPVAPGALVPSRAFEPRKVRADLAAKRRGKTAPVAGANSANAPTAPRRAPLPASPAAFFAAAEDLASFDSGIAELAVPGAILRRLGEPAFLRGAPHVSEAIEKAYDTVGERALREALGKSGAGGGGQGARLQGRHAQDPR